MSEKGMPKERPSSPCEPPRPLRYPDLDMRPLSGQCRRRLNTATEVSRTTCRRFPAGDVRNIPAGPSVTGTLQ